MTIFVNLTPHAINIADAAGDIIKTFPASGDVARCGPPAAQPALPVDGIPLVQVSAAPGPVVGLPAPAPETMYIVSGMVACHPDVVGRTDVVSPGTGPDDTPVRNDKGHIVAVRRFRQTV